MLVAALLAASTGGARAEIIDASSTTLVVGRPDVRDGVVHTAVPVFELVTVRATDLRLPGVDDMSIVASGWGAIAFGDRIEGEHGLGDLDSCLLYTSDAADE